MLEREGEYDTDVPDAQALPADEYVQESGLTAGVSGPGGRHDADEDGSSDIGQVVSLHEYLLQQLHLTRAAERDQVLVAVLIEELDENGFLPVSLAEVLEFLPAALGSAADEFDEDELLAALRLLQSFDPPVWVRVQPVSVWRCSCASGRPVPRGVSHEVFDCAIGLVTQHLEVLAHASPERLRAASGYPDDVVRQAHQLILSLDPKPGRAWSSSVADYVVPELVVVKSRQGWEARLNGAIVPRVRVNPVYEQWLREDRSGADKSPIQAQLQQAHGLVKSVAQRFETVLRVGQCIVAHQQGFFDKGVQAMRPLVLRDIAQDLEMHESTVSRATRQKYMQTPWGSLNLNTS
ncbi:RNA polymerase factor sigma-54 [Neopusillimonas aromaticivorans]|uniref:RNA polymerase factor sigma-54 n=1 Tax=Neopusillimonas aromaticivorans TaxID=2979868 RepID=UPI003D9E7AB0